MRSRWVAYGFTIRQCKHLCDFTARPRCGCAMTKQMKAFYGRWSDAFSQGEPVSSEDSRRFVAVIDMRVCMSVCVSMRLPEVA